MPRTIGIAGAREVQPLIRLSLDVAIDYRGKSVAALTVEIATACGGGCGYRVRKRRRRHPRCGAHEFAAARRASFFAAVSASTTAGEKKRRPQYLAAVIVKQGTMHGFSHQGLRAAIAEGAAQIARWVEEGRMRIAEDIVDGIEMPILRSWAIQRWQSRQAHSENRLTFSAKNWSRRCIATYILSKCLAPFLISCENELNLSGLQACDFGQCIWRERTLFGASSPSSGVDFNDLREWNAAQEVHQRSHLRNPILDA